MQERHTFLLCVCVCGGGEIEVGGRTTYNITGSPSLLIGLQPREEDWVNVERAGEGEGG